MDRQQAKELLPVIQAFAEGRPIEFKDSYGKWVVGETLAFNWPLKNYRIKPEPKYRPFINTEECWQEMFKHQPFGWIKDKENGAYVMITKVYDDSGEMSINGNTGWDFFRLMNYYTFPDGNLFGLKEEE